MSWQQMTAQLFRCQHPLNTYAVLPCCGSCCRLPAAYRLALAECARRAAWQEMFASQASRLAEHCGRITGKEAAKRDSVRRQLERHLPTELLAKAGLLAEPPHCMVGTPLAHEPICHMPALAACVVVDVCMAVSWLNTWSPP